MSSVVTTSHKRCLSVPETFKNCVSRSRNAKANGEDLENALKYFTNKIEEVELSVVNAEEIVKFLATADEENLRHNYFLGAKTKQILTAVVRCSFTDSETLLRSVKENCKKEKVNRIIVSSHAHSVQGPIEELREKTGHTVVVIEQLEAMDVDTFNRLISLLSFYEELSVSLLICLSTSRSLFYSHCSMNNQELLYLKFFDLPSPQTQLDKIIGELTRSVEKNAPRLYLSGDLLRLLKSRFLHGDFSLAEMKKIVRLAVVENFMREEEEGMEEDGDELPDRLAEYWEWFDTLDALMGQAHAEMGRENEQPHQLDVHSELQRDGHAFWSEHPATSILHTWLVARSRDELVDMLEFVVKAHKEKSPEAAATLSSIVAELHEETKRKAAAVLAAPAAAPSAAAAASPAAGSQKMNMTEFLRANRQKQAATAAAGLQLRQVVGRLLEIMKEKLFDWRKEGGEEYLLMVPKGGYEIPDLSRNLATRGDETLSYAYTTLAAIEQFKPVRMTEWGAAVAGRMGNGEFYDRVAQLEKMGAIKDMTRNGKKAVVLQLRPMTNFD